MQTAIRNLKKWIFLWTFALAPFSAVALQAQNIVGTWQGSLQVAAANRSLRVIVKITRADDEKLEAVMYSIDQSPVPIPIGTITQDGSAVQWTVPGIGGTYEGKLSADGNSISGTWRQDPMPLPLAFDRATPENAWAIPEPPPPPKAMDPSADPSFDVASIKLASPEEQARPGSRINVVGREFLTGNTSLRDLIVFAFSLHPAQLSGGPPWFTSEKFDITAKPDGEGAPSDGQWRIMVRKLLADRFQLKTHTEKRQLSVYVVTVAKNGPKLTASTGDPDGLPGIGVRGLGAMNFRNASMADFAFWMQTIVLDRPALDQTGLKGRFDFALNWMPDEYQFTAGPKPPPLPDSDANSAPNLYDAIQQQLGLKLESTKAPADVLVIDHVEEPTPN